MTALVVIAAVLGWLLLALPAAVVIGRAIRIADREQSAAREAAKLRHPSGKRVA